MRQRTAGSAPRAVRSSVDRRPRSAQEWIAFAALTPEARNAVYLRSIRAMLWFFTILTILGLIAGIVLALVGIHALDQRPVTSGLGG